MSAIVTAVAEAIGAVSLGIVEIVLQTAEAFGDPVRVPGLCRGFIGAELCSSDA